MPIGILAVLAAPRILSESRSEDRSRSYDLPGAITVTLALVLLVYALVGTTTYGWGATRTIAELVAAAALLGIFVAIEGRFAMIKYFAGIRPSSLPSSPRIWSSPSSSDSHSFCLHLEREPRTQPGQTGVGDTVKQSNCFEWRSVWSLSGSP